MKVRDKVILVSGGANGLGRELVLNLLSKGASVAAVDTDREALQETIEFSGDKRDKLSTHVVDVTQRDEIATLPERISAAHGTIDGIINNAGIIQPFQRIAALDYAAIERVMNTNFFGALYITKEFLPHLFKRPEAHITNISSVNGFLPVPGQTIYASSKAALKLFTEGLNIELFNTNVRVTLVISGTLDTNLAANSGVTQIPNQEELQRSIKTLDPAKAAKIIIAGIENNRSRILVGSDAKLMDLIYRLSPGYAAKMVFKQMQSLLPE